MKWFDTWFSNKCKEAWNNESERNMNKQAEAAGSPARGAAGRAITISRGLSNDGINFTVYNAVGGYVVEFKSYSVANDMTDTNLYVVPEGSDFGVEIGKIVTMECLKRT